MNVYRVPPEVLPSLRDLDAEARHEATVEHGAECSADLVWCMRQTPERADEDIRRAMASFAPCPGLPTSVPE